MLSRTIKLAGYKRPRRSTVKFSREPNQADALHLLGVVACQTGRHLAAVEYIEQAIRVQGRVPDFHNNLGEAYRLLRRFPEAIASYRRALELKPDYVEANNNMGVALAEEGKPGEAAVYCRRALELRPNCAEAHFGLGNALRDLGKRDEAVTCYRRAIELKPHYAEAHCNLGIVLRNLGKLDEAAASYRRATALKPAFAEAHNNLGAALVDQGRWEEAVACCREALALKPDYAGAYCNLGNALRSLGRLHEAVACCRRALELKPDLVEAHNNLGNALNDQGKLEEAAACYRRALELNPGYVEAHGNLGSLLEEMGDLQAAEDSFRAAARCNNRFVYAHWGLAQLRGARLPDQDLAVQRRLLAETDLTDAHRLLLHFGLAYVFDARGEYEKAAEHLEQANALQLAEWRKRGQAYDPQDHKSRIERMIAVCGGDFFARVRGFGLESELPVFVVGLPRSGTTLVEQILASHPQVFGAGEISLAGDTMRALGGQTADPIEGLRHLGRATAQHLASRHLERLRALNPAALRIVDKMPDNYLYLGLLAILFPRAKVVHCRRDLRDAAVSCWMTYFKDIRWANDPRHIASRFQEYDRIMAHWRTFLPVPLLEINYEETVSDLEGVARRLTSWCGLEWEPQCLQFYRARRPVSTASAVQVRQPVYTTSVGRWKHYEQLLSPLLRMISESFEFNFESGTAGHSSSGNS